MAIAETTTTMTCGLQGRQTSSDGAHRDLPERKLRQRSLDGHFLGQNRKQAGRRLQPFPGASKSQTLQYASTELRNA